MAVTRVPTGNWSVQSGPVPDDLADELVAQDHVAVLVVDHPGRARPRGRAS